MAATTKSHSKKPKIKSATKPKRSLKQKLDSVWHKESNIITWIAVFAILLLFLNVLVLRIRISNADAQAAVRTPKANGSIAVIQFQWQDNVYSDAMYKPLPGNKLVIVTTQILNISPNNLWLAPSIETYIRDANNTHYGMAIAEVNRPFVAGSYSPQQVASGDLSYAIPNAIKDPQWCYQLAASSGGGAPLCFPLNNYAKINK